MKKNRKAISFNFFNTKICLIDRIMKREYYLGIEEERLRKNKYHYNDRFDSLYDMPIFMLENLDQELQESCIRYSELKMAENVR